MKITKLTAENMMRLRAVSITPDGALVQITGRNAQGKSSVLSAIEAALGGASHAPAQPVRAGEDKARIVCTLDGGLVVRRTFTAGGGGSLVVEDADGRRYGSPQAVLDKLVGTLTFDPLAFTRLVPKQQMEALRQLLGLDFEAANRRRADLFAERTAANRQVAQFKAQLDPAESDPSLPTAEVSVAALAAELQRADADNAKRDNVDRQLQAMAQEAERSGAVVDRLERELAEARQRHESVQDRTEEFRQKVAKLPPKVDTKPLRERLAGAEATNVRIRLRERQAELARRLAGSEAESARLTAEMDQIDADQRAQLAAARFPVEGLALAGDGVTFNGVPFGQASSAEQIRASAAIALAMNPKLRVMLVRDGSLLDRNGLQMLAEFAEANDAQVWVERVSDGEAVGVVIEDGMVSGEGAEPMELAQAAGGSR